MNILILYSAAVAFCGMSTVLLRNSAIYSMAKNGSVGMSARYLFAGRVLIAVAALSAGLGAVTQYTTLHH